MDIFVGLAVVIVLGMVVGMSITATGKAVQALADQRRAVREAERALTLLQQGEASNHPIEQLDTTAPSGLTWVRVSNAIESQHAQP